MTNIYFDFLFVCTGLKVNQLVAYATRFLAVCVKKIMCSRTSTPQTPKDSVTDWLTYFPSDFIHAESVGWELRQPANPVPTVTECCVLLTLLRKLCICSSNIQRCCFRNGTSMNSMAWKLPYLLVYKSFFYDQKIIPKYCPWLIHKPYIKT